MALEHIKETKTVRYTQLQMYELIADVEHYPVFLPWCQRVEVLKDIGNIKIYRLHIGFKGLNIAFETKDTFTPPREIAITNQSKSFRHLESQWIIEPLNNPEEGSIISFSISFALKGFIMHKILAPMLREANKKILEAFEKRAKILYG